MNPHITNHDLPIKWWLKSFTRQQLRDIAHAHGIPRGRDKTDCAVSINLGTMRDGSIVTFTVATTHYPITPQ